MADAFYAGRDDLVLLRIERGQVTSEVRDEPSGADVFPHIYGPLNLDAVVDVRPLVAGAEGRAVGPGEGP